MSGVATKREQLNYSSVDWEILAEKEPFAEIRAELRQCINHNKN
jgi:hypothetical protein